MRIQIGRLHIWLWAGSWSPLKGLRLECECCAWNFYIGPFGVEWDPS